MATEICALCKEPGTPWKYIEGHICCECYYGAANGSLYSGWISVNKSVPPDDRYVLILHHLTDTKYPPDINIGYRKIFKNGKIKWKYFSWCGVRILCTEGEKDFQTITHWMPLPEVPK
jgi:hypothetical protein